MSQYSVYVIPEEFQAIKKLTGNVRQRIRRAIDNLADDPRSSSSKQLDAGDDDDASCEVRRVRLDNWRTVYLVSEAEKTVDVVAIRKRPPYDYGDLAELLSERP